MAGKNYGRYGVLDDEEASYAPDAPHNIGLPALKFWRPGLKPEHTDKKTGLETLPTTFEWKDRDSPFHGMTGDKSQPIVQSSADFLRRHVEALRAAKEYGVDLPKEVLDPKYLAAIALKEGRPDFGASAVFNKDNKKALEVYNKLTPRFGKSAAAFAASVYDKGQTAKRLDIPFTMAWNGTGKIRNDDGTLYASGENYAERFPQFLKAAEHPKNAQLVGFIDQYLHGKEYTSPLLTPMKEGVERSYEQRKRDAYKQTAKKLDEAPLRSLQYTFLGGADSPLGVPKEYDPQAMEAAVPAPDFEALRKQLNPKYKAGGSIERTTHDRKMI